MIITTLEIEGDAAKKLSSIESKEIPFAVAKSLTRTAQEAQSEIRRHIGQTFTIRKKTGGFAGSISIIPALKNRLEAEVYTMAGFASLQQLGGTRKPHGNALAIPDYGSLGDVKPRKGSAHAIPGAFVIKTGGGRLIMQRQGKNLRVLYYLRRQADISKLLNMLEIATDTAKRKFSFHLSDAIDGIR